MNKLVSAALVLGAGVLALVLLWQRTEQARAAAVQRRTQWEAATNRLAATQAWLAALRREVAGQRDRLRFASATLGLTPALMQALLAGASNNAALVSPELRQKLGLGWDASPEYVLVGKPIVKGLEYQRIISAAKATETARSLLALSSEEQAGLNEALERTRNAARVRIQRSEPQGDIVAQYTAVPPDAAFEQNLSNVFAAEITGAVGPERAGFLLPKAWREVRSDLVPDRIEKMTIRRIEVDGEPDLVCEMDRGGQVDTAPVRYARYPCGWFMSYFAGGWKTLAQREGFELPPRFQP